MEKMMSVRYQQRELLEHGFSLSARSIMNLNQGFSKIW